MSTAKTDNGLVLYNIGQIDDVGAYNKNKKNSYSLTGSPNELVTIPNDRATNRSSNDSIPNSSENVKYNKFWVHTIDIKNADGSQPAGASEGSITGYQTSVDKKSISQKKGKSQERSNEIFDFFG